MSNEENNKSINQPLANDQDDWVIFQNEVDSVRDVVLMYKTIQCTLNCSNFDCFFYHTSQDKRRKPYNKGKLVYNTQLCPEGDKCPNDNCTKSHNLFELNYHPWRFKTNPCEIFNNNNKNDSFNNFNSNTSTLNNINTNNNTNNSLINNSNLSHLTNNTNSSINISNSKIQNNNNTYYSTQSHNEKLCPYYHSIDQKRETKESLNSNQRKSITSSKSSFLNKIDLNIFKVFKCNNTAKHSEKQCIYYHSAKDRRRSQNQFYYISDTCYANQSDKCPNGDYCNKSHNQVEMFYHKDKFRSKFCSHYAINKGVSEINNECPYGMHCSFAHCEKEITVDLIHKMEKNLEFFIYYFKTVVCPYDHKHDKSICEYSHNLQDFRRNPKKHIYEKKNCSKWDNKKTVLCYSDGCPDAYSCVYCHGWKELDFHPLSYKTTKCKNYRGNCEKGTLCPFYHNFENKRIVDEFLKKEYDSKIKAKIQQNFKFNYSKNNNKLNFMPPKIDNNYMNMSNNNIKNNLNLSEMMMNTNNSNNLNMNMNTNNNKHRHSGMLNSSQMGIPQPRKHNSIFSNNNNNDFDAQSVKSFNIAIEKNYIFNPQTHLSTNLSGRVFTTNSYWTKSNAGSDFENNISKKSISPVSSDNDNSFPLTGRYNSNLINMDFSVEYSRTKIDDIDTNMNYEDRIENIEKKNKEIKELFDMNVFDQSKEENLTDWLEENGFFMLVDKIDAGELGQNELINMPDEKILEYVEDENKDKINELREYLMKLDENQDANDLLQSIEKQIGI